MAYANTHWKSLENPNEVLVLFQGPHSYISPSWYQQNDVPTWNYSSVRVYGIPKIIDDDVQKKEMLQKLVKYSESRLEKETGKTQWSIESLSEEYFSLLRKKIKFFTIKIHKIEGKFKMSQNRSIEDQEGVIVNLSKGSVGSQDAGKQMKDLHLGKTQE